MGKGHAGFVPFSLLVTACSLFLDSLFFLCFCLLLLRVRPSRVPLRGQHAPVRQTGLSHTYGEKERRWRPIRWTLKKQKQKQMKKIDRRRGPLVSLPRSEDGVCPFFWRPASAAAPVRLTSYNGRGFPVRPSVPDGSLARQL